MAFSEQGSVSGLLCQLDTPKHFVLHSICITHKCHRTLTHSYFKILGNKGRSLCSSLVSPLPFTGLQEAILGASDLQVVSLGVSFA